MAAPEHSAKTCYNDGFQLQSQTTVLMRACNSVHSNRCHRLRAGLSEGRIRVTTLNTSHIPPPPPSLSGSGKALHSWHSGSPPHLHFSQTSSLHTSHLPTHSWGPAKLPPRNRCNIKTSEGKDCATSASPVTSLASLFNRTRH